MSDMNTILLIMVLGAPALYLGQSLVLDAVERRARVARMTRVMSGRQGQVLPHRTPLPKRIGQALGRVAAITSERVSVVRGGEAEASAELLRAAGFRSRDAVLIYAFLKLVLPILGAGLAALWFWLNFSQGQSLLLVSIWVIGTALGLSKAPDIYLTFLRNRRFKQIRKAFPDMLELLVIASEAGLGAGPALGRVANEISGSAPALSIEMQQLVIELSVLPNRSDAWIKLSERLPLSEISVFANALHQAERYGTPFAGALRTLMRDERSARLLRIEEHAGRIPALMTIPLILFIMPALFMVLIGPAVLNILDNIIDGGFG